MGIGNLGNVLSVFVFTFPETVCGGAQNEESYKTNAQVGNVFLYVSYLSKDAYFAEWSRRGQGKPGGKRNVSYNAFVLRLLLDALK